MEWGAKDFLNAGGSQRCRKELGSSVGLNTWCAHYDSILVSASVCIKDFLLSALKYGYTNILQSKHLGYIMFLGYEPRPRKLWRGELENLELVYFLEADLSWEFSRWLSFSGDLVLVFSQVVIQEFNIFTYLNLDYIKFDKVWFFSYLPYFCCGFFHGPEDLITKFILFYKVH